MKTATSTPAKCPKCSLVYNPQFTAAECPHRSSIETPLLKRLREQGPPYKIPPGSVKRSNGGNAA
jgi:hypothetical protein